MSEAVTVLALNSDESGLERIKVNANKHLIVDNTQNTQPVSGAFYPATQPISAASALLVDGSAVTQPVSGAFYPATQPISAAVALTVDGSAVTQPVSGAFYPATQPISAAVALLVDGSAVTQPVSGSVSITGSVATTGGALSVANNSMFSSEVISDGSSAQSAGLDISSSLHLVIYGDTNNLSDEVGVEISFDNSVWYDLGLMLYPDGTTGNFAKEVETSAKYIRLNKTNNSGSSETISASVMVKS